MMHTTDILCVVVAAILPVATPDVPSSRPGGEAVPLQARLDAALKRLDERTPEIERELREAAAELQKLEAAGTGTPTPQQAARREELAAVRTALQNEVTALQQAATSLQSALDSHENRQQYVQDLADLRARNERLSYGPAELAAFRAQVDRNKSVHVNVTRFNNGRIQRLEELRGQIAKANPQTTGQAARRSLEAQLAALSAQIEASRESLLATEAQTELLEFRIATAATAPASRPVPASGPADHADVENKQKLAEFMDREARGEQEEARRRLRMLREALTEAKATGAATSKLEEDRDYWQEKLNYEERRLRQAEMEKRAAAEKRALAGIQQKLRATESLLEELQQTVRRMPQEEREERAARLRAQAEEARQRALRLDVRVDAERPDGEMWSTQLRSLEAIHEAVRERLDRDYNIAHYLRMRNMLDTQRQQINALMNISEVIGFALLRQATLERRLADLQVQCADVLVPPVPGFWERQRKVIHSVEIVGATFAGIYGVNLLIWLIQRVARRVSAHVGSARFSLKRLETLLSFSGSIIKLFLWVFAVIMVLNVFGIDPAKSTGAIGLVGLIMAGMFQQLVIDFVKGLDIVTGRHYNVGDFVELDGKAGHVIDFNVKHTRIRTASGQEYNLPNSRCIPSRRFPDGYVDNYVDVPLKSAGDAPRAKRLIAQVARHLSRRVEQVKDEPVLTDRFPGPGPDGVVLRYRVRVLPACDWIITGQFMPSVKNTLLSEGIELSGEPTFFFINRIQTFRQLFSRQLSEEEILREAKETEAPMVERAEEPSPVTAGSGTAATPGSVHVG